MVSNLRPSYFIDRHVTFPIIISLKKKLKFLEAKLKYLLLILLIITTPLLSKNVNQTNNDEYTTCSDFSLDIPSSYWGISFGNSKSFNGLRFNYRDCDVETINGLNFTLWESKSIINSEVNGISFGVTPHASRLHGINIGLGAIVAEEEMLGLNFGLLSAVSNGSIYGINFGGLALVSEGELTGINLAGLALVSGNSITGLNFGGLSLVANNDISGINVGGLALVSDGNITGINFGGLACVSKGSMTGLNMSSLALVAEGELTGFNFGGLALVSKSGITGINISGLALVSEESIKGINLGGFAIVCGDNSLYGLSFTLGQIKVMDSISGISISGYKTESIDFTGINFTLAWTEFENMNGFSLAGYNEINDTQNGLTIGIINFAENLNGVQIGLINIANNNSGILKVLPFINAHL